MTPIAMLSEIANLQKENKRLLETLYTVQDFLSAGRSKLRLELLEVQGVVRNAIAQSERPMDKRFHTEEA